MMDCGECGAPVSGIPYMVNVVVVDKENGKVAISNAGLVLCPSGFLEIVEDLCDSPEDLEGSVGCIIEDNQKKTESLNIYHPLNIGYLPMDKAEKAFPALLRLLFTFNNGWTEFPPPKEGSRKDAEWAESVPELTETVRKYQG